MRYDDSAEKSAEFLRLALPLMARQRAATHPVSYALWYEYVSGANPALRDEVDACLKEQDSLDEKSTYALHQKHVSEFNEDLARYRSLSPTDIRAAVQAFLPRDRRVELTVVPESKPQP